MRRPLPYLQNTLITHAYRPRHTLLTSPCFSNNSIDTHGEDELRLCSQAMTSELWVSFRGKILDFDDFANAWYCSYLIRHNLLYTLHAHSNAPFLLTHRTKKMKEQPSGVVFNYITSEVKSLKLVFPILRKITGELFEKVSSLCERVCVCTHLWLRVCVCVCKCKCVWVFMCVCVRALCLCVLVCM
jgi:hypothetical protein